MNNKKGFTLVELLAVIGVIALIAGLIVFNVITAFNKGKESAFKEEVTTIYNLAMSQKEVDKYLPLFDNHYDGINAKLLLDEKDNFDYKIIFDSTLETISYLCVYNGTYRLEMNTDDNINVDTIKHAKVNAKGVTCTQQSEVDTPEILVTNENMCQSSKEVTIVLDNVNKYFKYKYKIGDGEYIEFPTNNQTYKLPIITNNSRVTVSIFDGNNIIKTVEKDIIKVGTEYSATYEKGSAVSIEKESDTCCAGSSGSCTVIAPLIVPPTDYNVVGWNTNQNAEEGIAPGENIALNSDKIYYAIIKENGKKLVDAITSGINGGPYIKEGSYNSLTNLFVGKYVVMDPDYNNGNIPNPDKNSATTTPCNTTSSGAISAGVTGNCDVSTYCKNSSGISLKLGMWRIVYVEDLYNSTDTEYSNKNSNANFYIVTSSSVECYTSSSVSSSSHVSNMNNVASKYCNDDLVDGGLCSTGTNIRVINGTDFERISQYTLGLRNLSAMYSFEGCKATSASTVAGENVCFGDYSSTDKINDPVSLIHNGEYYWFGEPVTSGSALYLWWPNYKYVGVNYSNHVYGIRPVLKLKSGIKYSGGTGTADDPYRIVPN